MGVTAIVTGMVCSDVALKKVSKRPRWKTNQIRIELETSEDAFGTALVRGIHELDRGLGLERRGQVFSKL